MRNRISIIMVLIAWQSVAFAGAWEASSKAEVSSVYEKALNWYSSNSNCQVNVRYSSFKDHTTSKAYDESFGYFKKNKDQIRSSALGIVTIQNAQCNIIVDSASQLIVIKNKSDMSRSLFDAEAFTASLEKVKVFKKQ